MLQSTDGVLLNSAWKKLWTPGTNYYLPAVMANGLKFGNYDIPPLASTPVNEIGPLQLFKNALGYISITMKDIFIQDLPSIQDNGFEYDDTTKTLTLSVKFAQLLFNGAYEVDSGGVTGCAIASANGILNIINSAGKLNADDNIDLAYQYRDKLSEPANPNGSTLVEMFYEQNNTINTVVMAENSYVDGKVNETNGFFHNQWLNKLTDGKDTSYYMGTTSNAASEPDNPDTGFNDDSYNKHGFYMEFSIVKEAIALRDLGDPRGDQLYNAIYTGGTSLDTEAQNYNGNSISDYMNYVGSGGSVNMSDAEKGAAIKRKAALIAQVKQEVDKDHEDWIKNKRHEEYLKGNIKFSSVNDAVQITGNFTDLFVSPVATLKATVALDSNKMLVVTVTEVDVDIPQLQIILNPDVASDLNTEVQNYIANTSFVIDILKAKIEDGISTDDVKDYLSDRMNQALAEIFG